MRKLREDHEEAEIEGGELNLVPYLDIVTNIIMFLMMTTTFAAALGNVNVSSPTTARSTEPTNPDTPPPRDLNLTVQISDKGFTLAASGAVLYENDVPGKLPTLPKITVQSERGPILDFDYAGLTRKMAEIKDKVAGPEDTKVIINANPEITYESVIATMDAARNQGPKVLFPDVLLSAGVN
jgi:biopolymer transport protein ExbD